MTEKARSKPHRIICDLGLGAFRFPADASQHFDYLMFETAAAKSGLVREYLEQIPVFKERMFWRQIKDFSGGPFGSLVVSQEVRDALPTHIVENSRFTPLQVSPRKPVTHYSWVLEINEPFIALPKDRHEEKSWNFEAIQSTKKNLVRDVVLRGDWICVSRGDGTYDFKRQYDQMGWEGLQFVESAEGYKAISS